MFTMNGFLRVASSFFSLRTLGTLFLVIILSNGRDYSALDISFMAYSRLFFLS